MDACRRSRLLHSVVVKKLSIFSHCGSTRHYRFEFQYMAASFDDLTTRTITTTRATTTSLHLGQGYFARRQKATTGHGLCAWMCWTGRTYHGVVVCRMVATTSKCFARGQNNHRLSFLNVTTPFVVGATDRKYGLRHVPSHPPSMQASK